MCLVLSQLDSRPDFRRNIGLSVDERWRLLFFYFGCLLGICWETWVNWVWSQPTRVAEWTLLSLCYLNKRRSCGRWGKGWLHRCRTPRDLSARWWLWKLPLSEVSTPFESRHRSLDDCNSAIQSSAETCCRHPNLHNCSHDVIFGRLFVSSRAT